MTQIKIPHGSKIEMLTADKTGVAMYGEQTLDDQAIGILTRIIWAVQNHYPLRNGTIRQSQDGVALRFEGNEGKEILIPLPPELLIQSVPEGTLRIAGWLKVHGIETPGWDW